MAAVAGTLHGPLLKLVTSWSVPVKVAQAGAVGIAIGLGMAVYCGLGLLLRSPELREILRALSRKKQTTDH
jgi:hypothetical protein